MTDREKVISGLECCKEGANYTDPICSKCPYNYADDCVHLLAEEALELLKAQEAVEPIYGEDNYIRCGKCKHNIVGIIAQDTGNRMPIQKFCAECGQAVKWE